MLLQIVVVFRISLQFTCIFGSLMGFNPFSQRAHVSPAFSGGRRRRKKSVKGGNGLTSGASSQ